MHSIYFISPTEEIVEQVIKDFTPPTVRLATKRKGPAYAAAHLFFTGAISHGLFEKLAASAAAPFIKTFVETYINFIAMESKAYHLGADVSLFSKMFKPKPAGLQESGADFQAMADQIVSACVTMNEIPSIRYQKVSINGNALKLAALVQEGLDGYCSKNPTMKPLKDGQLLITDRTIDLLAPLLHEFTLQAMANDLLTITDGTKFTYKYSSGASESSRDVTLDENDSMWIALRHLHIADVSKKMIQKFNEFIAENKAAQTSSSKQSSSAVSSLAELRETMNDLGEFHEMKAIYSLHLSIAQECLSIFEKKKLMGVAKVEQNIATGLDSEGEDIREHVWSDMAALLEQPSLSPKDKARLVMLYLLTQPQLSDQDRKSLFDHAKLNREELETVKMLAYLGQNSKNGYTQRNPACVTKKGHRKTILDEEPPYEVSRYVPALKIILDDAFHGELDDQEFPFLKGSASSATTAPKASAPVSLRARVGAASTMGKEAAGSSTGSISVFVLGGMTYSEMRSVYELTIRNGREFYIGSDRLLTPEDFINLLRDMNK
jgi:syntaxin-binding protein 1